MNHAVGLLANANPITIPAAKRQPRLAPPLAAQPQPQTDDQPCQHEAVVLPVDQVGAHDGFSPISITSISFACRAAASAGASSSVIANNSR